MRSRALVYFGGLLATIAVVNTPVPRIVVSAVRPKPSCCAGSTASWTRRAS
ncbi:hypothetical protein [Lentzea albida]|uniref:hypothetical protein n=1 Tax=Lentzea albida TaxID=65499 RepID=UPI0015A6266B|nr:hypothetical protein [Lentzea albida]